MGLADEKIKVLFQEYVTKTYEKGLAEQGLPMKFAVDWNTLSGLINQNVADRAQTICGEFAGKCHNYLINLDSTEMKMLVDAIKASFDTFKIVHSPTGQEYAYTLAIKDKTCVFTADMSKFTWHYSSRDDQPSFKEYLEKIL